MSDVQRRHEHFMREALALAQEAAEFGEVPVGCVIVRNDEVIGRGYNYIQNSADPTLHAEVVAIRDAIAREGEKFLEGAILYVTLEPCVMCAGAILMAHIGTVVYGTAEPKTGAARSLYELLDDPRTNHQCIVRSGVLEQECAAVLTTFFGERRAENGERPAASSQRPAISDHQPATSDQRLGTLILVPTPIGNLGDITKRALETMQSADAVLCEDTRTTGQLLRHYGIIAKQLLSNHEHNERARATEVVRRIGLGETIALVSDAGMPGISDPGYRAVQACVEAGLRVEALPGANAALTAIAASGLPTDTWYFGGFPPQKKGRATFIANLVQRTETCVLYESPHRMERLLTELVEHAGPDREVVVARELTKLHEEYLRGTVGDVLLDVQRRGGLKGECVVVIRGATKP